jgi:hypothetical protein
MRLAKKRFDTNSVLLCKARLGSGPCDKGNGLAIGVLLMQHVAVTLFVHGVKRGSGKGIRARREVDVHTL